MLPNMLRATSLALALTLSGCGSSEGPEGPSGHSEHDGLYTCGMHPQVVQDAPGTCPICGMNLTPMRDGAAPPAAKGERKVAYWQAPMDPTYVRDAPGKSPMGMDLVPVYEDEAGGGDGDYVDIDPGVIQQAGVELATVERSTVFRHLRTIGEVDVGEDELSVVNLRFSGWVERIRVDKTGDAVERGQVLFEIYSPELVAAQEEYLLALRSQGAESALARAARRRLELYDVARRDIEALLKRGEATRTLPIRAPQAGFVLHKNIVEGARVQSGRDLYRIGNLQRIWITAEVYEHDAPWVEQGQPAQLELTNQAIGTLEGKVSYIYPTLDSRSRTLKVRLEFDNPGVRLKPGMFATVHIQYRRKDDVIAVPTEAVLHSGRRTLVFLARGRGRFEPRDVQLGLQGDHRMTEIVSGLAPGDRVVTSGQFLIDSESQLQEALKKILASSRGEEEPDEHAHADTVWSCPMHPEVVGEEGGRCTECGMFLEERPATEADRPPAGAEPGQFTCPMHPEIVRDDPGRCPECGMFLEQVPNPDGDDAGEPHAGHGGDR